MVIRDANRRPGVTVCHALLLFVVRGGRRYCSHSTPFCPLPLQQFSPRGITSHRPPLPMFPARRDTATLPDYRRTWLAKQHYTRHRYCHYLHLPAGVVHPPRVQHARLPVAWHLRLYAVRDYRLVLFPANTTTAHHYRAYIAVTLVVLTLTLPDMPAIYVDATCSTYLVEQHAFVTCCCGTYSVCRGS